LQRLKRKCEFGVRVNTAKENGTDLFRAISRLRPTTTATVSMITRCGDLLRTNSNKSSDVVTRIVVVFLFHTLPDVTLEGIGKRNVHGCCTHKPKCLLGNGSQCVGKDCHKFILRPARSLSTHLRDGVCSAQERYAGVFLPRCSGVGGPLPKNKSKRKNEGSREPPRSSHAHLRLPVMQAESSATSTSVSS
jgi:hypothetical protein